MVRDVAVEHCKEDLSGKVPTLQDWFTKTIDQDFKENDLMILNKLSSINNQMLKEFILRPYLRSGVKESLIITNSNFGLTLASKFFNIDEVMDLSHTNLFNNKIDVWLRNYTFTANWQFTPSNKDISMLNSLR